MSRLHADTLRKLHLAAMVVWALMVVPALLWWRSSVAFVVFVSIYANFAAHFSAWQGTRAEAASGGNDSEGGS